MKFKNKKIEEKKKPEISPIAEINEWYSIIYVKWNDKIQLGTYCHTIQEALEIIKMLSGYNNTGIYHIVTPYCKYEVINLVTMDVKKINDFYKN